MSMIKPKEMAKRLGITVKGILKAYRTPTNRRILKGGENHDKNAKSKTLSQ